MPIAYQARRNELLFTLGLGMCAHCGIVEKLTIHHCDGNGHSHGLGGIQQLHKLETDLTNGVEMIVLCRSCHEEEHRQLCREMNE